MRSLTRGLLGACLAFGLAVVLGPSHSVAQAKKDDKKMDKKEEEKKDDKKKDEKKKYSVITVNTFDGVLLGGYWFPSSSTDSKKNGENADAVIMVPAPKSDLSKGEWLALAESISSQGFAVLAFDWRGHGQSGVVKGTQVFDNRTFFEDNPYNRYQFGQTLVAKASVLDQSKFKAAYWDMLLTDLTAARGFIDSKNDAKQCNAGRIWIVSEKDGAHIALSFIAAEFYRNSFRIKAGGITAPEQRYAGLDYAGLVAISYSNSSGPLAAKSNKIYRSLLFPERDLDPNRTRAAKDHFAERLACLFINGDKVTDATAFSSSQSLINSWVNNPKKQDEQFKWVREVKDAKKLTGISLVDPMNTLNTKETITKYFQIVSDKQAAGKKWLERNPLSRPDNFNFGIFNMRAP
jgi:hypothetical protein